MTVHLSAIVLSLMLGAIAFPQDQEGLKKTSHSPVSTSPAPVTRLESSVSFDRIGRLFNSVLHLSIPANGKVQSPNSPVTRSEVIEEFARYYRLAEPTFKLTPKTVEFDVNRIKVDQPSVKKDLMMLIKRGCVASYGMLSTGTVKTVSVGDFGDAIGMFIARIAEMTHTSSTKWTPYLHGN